MFTGKVLRQALDKFLKGEVAANARVQVILPNGEFYDIDGVKFRLCKVGFRLKCQFSVGWVKVITDPFHFLSLSLDLSVILFKPQNKERLYLYFLLFFVIIWAKNISFSTICYSYAGAGCCIAQI